MDNEQPHQELVKCVVVGDTAVGKTRLICARACNTRVSLHQLMTTHIPTVWAIDQYRIYKEVLQRSWEVVDSVSVSLRLWDTFGDHDKDRRFAYGRSDVVLLCFSIANPLSLRNAKVVWYPEIRKFCPSTPIVLVGCKNDLRFMYVDETFVSIVNERRSFVKPIKESDIVSPEQCRAVAKEIGAPYYETSVLTYYGVEEVFENVIRAALIARRHARFWMTNLKKVQKPLLQYPFLPPKPQAPEILVPPSQLEEDLRALLHNQAYCDVLFVAGNVAIAAHKVVLAIASQTFLDILMTDLSAELIQRRDSDCSASVSLGQFNADTEKLIHDDSESSQDSSPLHKPPRPISAPEQTLEKFFHQLQHSVFSSLHLQEMDLSDHSGRTTIQLIVTLNEDIYPAAFEQCLKYLFCGTFDFWATDLDKVRKIAENLLIMDIVNMIDNVRRGEEFMNDEIRTKFFINRANRIRELCIQKGIFSDVVFQLEDGTLSAHKPLLMARCDVMFAMFSGDFLESSAKVVPMPGVNKECFKFLLEYLYTDMCPPLRDVDCLEIIELANRLCLPRLVAMVEQSVVQELTTSIDSDNDVAEDVLLLLEPAQLHNAKQLSAWCLNYIAANYNEVCKKLSKLLKNLHLDNQTYLLRHRWPPVWYLKEYDLYEKGLTEREKEEQPLKLLKRHRNSSGCLCFTGKARRNADKTEYYSM